ncbi:MAG: DUF4440 domain-containing protein [Rhodanobacteraceae bacterium]
MISFEMKVSRSLLAIACVLGMSIAASAQTPARKAATSAPPAPQAAIGDGSDEDVQAVVKLEMATLEWSRHNDRDKMAAHHAEDWIGIPGVAPMTRAQMLADVGTETLRSYKISNVMTRQLAKDVVLVSYRMQQDGASADGTPWQPLVQASAVWVRRNGKWLSAFYQETVL